MHEADRLEQAGCEPIDFAVTNLLTNAALGLRAALLMATTA